jgi:hypothetical protein
VTKRFTVWCNTDDDGGPDLHSHAHGVELVDADAWSAWLDEHAHHDLSLVIENLTGLPFFQANRGGIRFEVPTEDEIRAAYAWQNFRTQRGVHASKEVREHEHAAFLAGWAAARQRDAVTVPR